MNNLKRLVALVLALALSLALCGTAFAFTGNGGTKTINVNNAMIGEKYTIYKLFDATTDGTNIAYTLISPATDVPTEVAGIFQKTTITEGIAPNTRTYEAITKVGTPNDDTVQAALKAWAANATEVGHIDCTASPVVFDNLTPGYYVIVSTFDDGNNSTVEKVIGISTVEDTTNVYEKNTVEITVVKDGGTDYSIGDTVEYTVTFEGPNYRGEGEAARIVTKYVVTDTLPEFLSGAAVTKIKIGTTEYTDTDLNDTNFPGVSTFGTTKTFDIPWATKGTGAHDWTSKYTNGTKVEITYTATLTKIVKIDGTTNSGNINTVDISPVTDTPDNEQPWDEHHQDSHEIFTYGAALKKTDGNGTFLPGAKFHFKGLTLVAEGSYTKGVYRVDSYNSSATTYGTEVEVGDDGKLYILGLASSVDLTGEETEAPAGYNKLTSTFTLEPQQMSHTIWSSTEDKYFDAKGNLVAAQASATTTTEVTKNIGDLDTAALEVINNPGAQLPSTGGIGTTIFYVAGIVLVLGAAAIVIARRKAEQE